MRLIQARVSNTRPVGFDVDGSEPSTIDINVPSEARKARIIVYRVTSRVRAELDADDARYLKELIEYRVGPVDELLIVPNDCDLEFYEL